MAKTFLFCDWSKKHQAFIGVITDKNPRVCKGTVTVLDVEKADTRQKIIDWHKEASRTRPWLRSGETKEYTPS